MNAFHLIWSSHTCNLHAATLITANIHTEWYKIQFKFQKNKLNIYRVGQ